MIFQAENGEDYIIRHIASKSEFLMQFDPPIYRLLAVTTNGVYYSTPVPSSDTGEEFTNQTVIHYANDGMLTEMPFLNSDNIRCLVISLSGSSVAWSQSRIAKTPEDQEIDVSELYSATSAGSDVRLRYRLL